MVGWVRMDGIGVGVSDLSQMRYGEEGGKGERRKVEWKWVTVYKSELEGL